MKEVLDEVIEENENIKLFLDRKKFDTSKRMKKTMIANYIYIYIFFPT